MKLKTLVPLLALVVLMAIPTMGSARMIHDFSCDYCHKANMVLDDVSTIICLDCHSTGHSGDTFTLYRSGSGSTNPVGQALFVEGDASDALGSSSASGATPGDQTSHNWGASDTNPAAGASAPIDPLFYGRSNYSGATVSCGRCHDPHGYNADDRGVGSTNLKLLKLGAGTEDAMCVDCHTSWNTTPANAYLTHPLTADYPGVQAANPAKFKVFAPNGDMSLVSGNIVCSTCHGVHYTDSDAATTDGMGLPLNVSDGSLLKGNGKLTGETSGVCQSCHTYKMHGTGQVGCIDCHSGHAYNNGSPNYFILRDNVSLAGYPVGAPPSPGTNMVYNSTTYPWKNAGSGYCENCHTLPATHNGLVTGGATECGSCHNHSDTSAAFTAGNCTTCHGYPPVNGSVAGSPDGYAFDPGKSLDYSTDPNFKDDTNAKHGLHAGSGAAEYKFDCGECHGGNAHDGGTFQDVFNTPTTFVSANSALAPAYDKTGNGTCSAVYCHSNGGPRGAAPTAAAVPTWVAGSVTCSSCHGNTAITMAAALNSGTHQKHLAKGYDCSLCHNSTAANSTTLSAGAIQGTHVNGTADVVFDAASSFTQLNAVSGVYGTDGTCQNVYCHSAGPNATVGTTPDWDLASTGQCGSCHQVNASGDTGATLPDAHNTHVFDTNGPQLACTTCHTNNGTGADHIDGFISTVASLQTAVCNSCHGIDGAEVAPVWTTPGSDDCMTCHTGTSLSTIGTQAPDKSSALTTGHNLAAGNYLVSGYSAANQTCESCHDKAATHLAGSGNKRLKAAFSCDTCHGTGGTATVNNINTHQAKLCLTCHDPHGSTNIYMVKPTSTDFSGTVVFSARTGADSFDEADSANADDLCATCHTAANQTTQHNNKENVGVHGGGSKQGADCLTCHKPHTDATNAFAVGAGTSCDGCHGFPPATGVHASHSLTTVNTDAEDRSDCAVCHTGADSYTYDPTADQGNSLNHSNATNRPGIITAAVGFNTTDQTCANACHTSTTGNGGTWIIGSTLACDACHYYSVTPTSAGNNAAPTITLPDSSTNSQPLTGTHNKHFDAGKTCADCHTVPADMTHNTIAVSGTDVQKIQGLAVATQDEADILGTVGSDIDPGDPTCNNVACHNPSNDGHSAVWNGAAATCDLCHSSTDPATNNHTAHLNSSTTFGVTIACTDCHADNGVNMAHLDGTVDLTGTKVSAYTSPNCTNSCHQDGRTGAAAVTSTWGMVAQPDCTICHAQQPATGSHTKHLAADSVPGTPINCANCHDNTVDNTTAATQHLDLNVDAFDATPADLGYPVDKTLNTAFTNCTTANCHTDGRGNQVATPTWGANSACVECHTTMTTNGPATGSHNKHMTTALNTSINCGMCHISTTNPDTDTEPSSSHRDGDIDVMEGYPSNKIIGSAYASCSNAVDGTLLCHDNGLGAPVASPTWGATPANCSTCHATQPATGSHTVHLAADKTPGTPISCGDCHDSAVQGTTAPSQHGDFNVDVFDATPGDLGYPQDVVKGIGTWTTCTAASCHNDGQSGNNADLGNVGSSLVTTPQWGTAATCSECHVAVPTSAKHDEHLGSYGATCGDCHAGATQNVSGGTNHRNGNIDVRAQLNYSAAGAPGNGWGTCTNPAGLAGACHGTVEARPWDGSAGGCTACHGQSGTTGEPLIGADMISTNPLGQHNTHVNTQGYSCNTCHNGHGMPTTDDKITMAFTGLATGGTYNPPGTWTTGKWLYNQTSTTGTQDCSNLYCHSSGQPDGGGAAAPTYATPDWGNVTTGQCGTCHQGDGVSGNATTIATGSHIKHIADGATCNTCHSANIHVNQQVEVTTGTYTSTGAVGNGYGNCSTASCHDNGTGTPTTTPTWGTNSACTECHTLPMASGSHTVHLGATVNAVCTDCHAAGTDPTTDSIPSVGHRDSNIDVLNALGYPQNKTIASAYVSCATASCHVTNRNTTGATPVWGTTVSNCTECHTTPPTGDDHTNHLNAKTNNIYGQTIGCTDCHDAATNVATQTPPATGHQDGNIDAAGGYPAKLISDATYKSCNAASCHQTGQAPNSYVTTSNFNIDDANCTQCHAASPTSGSHAKHIASIGDCAVCHTGATKDTSYSVVAHGDGNVDVSINGTYAPSGTSYTANKTYGAAKENCTNITCHSDGLSGTPGTSPIWGTASGCAACHNDNQGANLLTTGSHSAHLGSTIMASISCSACHNTADPANSTPPAQHTDNNVDVFATNPGDLGYPQNAAIGSGSWNTCNAASCHDDGTGTLVVTPTWGSATAACTECHAAAPATNAHGTHLALSGVTCGTCHPGAVQGTTPSTGHLNNQIDITAGFGYTAGAEDKGGVYGSCATASCHNDGQGNSVASPNWAAGATTCNSCHNTTPTTGSHTPHINNSEAGAISCGNCHGDAVVGTSPATGVHVNDNVDVFDATSGDLGYPTTAALGTASWSTCNNASCHTDGTGTKVVTPTWGSASAACTACHDAAPATGAHTTHLNAAANGLIASLDCINCHNDAVKSSKAPTGDHRDGNLDVYNTAPGDLGYTANVTSTAPTYNTETCNTSYCHGDAMPKGTVSGTTNAPTWSMTSTGCIFCHDMPPMAIGAHAGQTLTTCVNCHGLGKGDVNSTGTGFTNGGATHINGALNGGGDNCNDCHSTVGGIGNGPSDLSAGHKAHVFVAYTGKISTGDYGNYTTNSWYTTSYINDAADGDKRKLSLGCGFCHPQSNVNHATGTPDVNLSNADTGAAGTLKALNGAGASYNLSVCDNVYCHSDGNGTFASSPNWTTGSVSGNCNDCHGNSPTTNAHSVHTVGIHYTDLYDSDRVGVMQAAALTNAAHGDVATSTTITCVICHGDTVSITPNDQNDVCVTCHTGGLIKGNLGIASTSITHVNGLKDVKFNLTGFKSKAQLRDDITTVTELNNSWTRTNGYKQPAGTSHDVAKTTATYAAGTCSAIVCHNGNSASWTDPVAGNCMKCHTALPQ